MADRKTIKGKSGNRRRIALCLGLLCLIAGVVSCSSPKQKQQSETVTALKVIDGDTIILTDGRKVRYMCVDTPERGEPWNVEATELNRQLVEGETIELRFGKRPTDRYGRTLAMVRVAGINLADTLISAGLAMVYGFSDNADFLPPLIRRQREAIDQRLGIWSQNLTGDENEYIGSMTGYRFHRPNCEAAGKIKLNRIVRYQSKRDAFYDGLSPCGRCKP